MFEFDQYEPSRHSGPRLTGPPGYRPLDGVADVSFMAWGEHCIECADPGCYQSCALYQARPDGRCRRFAYGIFKNRRFRGVRGYGAEVTFKTWGKLEAEGNAFMEPLAAVLRRERLVAWGGGSMRVAASLTSPLIAPGRWRDWPPPPRKIARRLHRGTSGSGLPDAFLIEVFNPADRPVTLQLEMRAVGDDGAGGAFLGPPPFLHRIGLPPGFFRTCIEAHRFRHILASGHRFKISVMPEAEQSITLVFLALDFVRMAKPVPADAPRPAPGKAAAAKCVVFDLDGTLWDGVLAEGAGVALRAGVPGLFRDLDARGILISVASKNDHAEAWARLEAFGLADYVLHPRIGWGPKSIALCEIAAALDIGLDTFVFVDDSPFERAEVARALPAVECRDATELGGLADHPRLCGSDSSEAGRRRQLYREAIRRDQERRTWGDDYLGFLAACNMELTIRPYQPGDFTRVSELVQRTNQLNFSGRKYAPDDLSRRLDDVGTEKLVLTCRDRYGDHGTVGFALVARSAGTVAVDDLMLSCRVQGRMIEAALFRCLWDRMPTGHRRLWVRLSATGRNRPAHQVLEQLGFRPEAGGDGYVIEEAAGLQVADVITVCSSLDGAPPAEPANAARACDGPT
ncbi:MAG: HAD-IIIC family phosphatase [Rhodospirillales bacterium]|nr:MAG: HAD-IIIC family phosphatase [Rhodospirillales bacterium]